MSDDHVIDRIRLLEIDLSVNFYVDTQILALGRCDFKTVVLIHEERAQDGTGTEEIFQINSFDDYILNKSQQAMATLLNNIFVKTCTLLILGSLLIQYNQKLFAQQYFTSLKRGEYKVVEEDTNFNPGAKISGSYEAFGASRRLGFFNGDAFGGKIYQDISLNLQSKVNTNVSLHVKLGHKSFVVSEQDSAYSTAYPSESRDSTSDDGFNVVFDEAFLEYNHNPNASLRIGRQYIDMGDRKGLIFEGEATAISQGCRIGTWCYSIGGARIGEGGSSALLWAQLDYPVFESGVLIPDPWGNKPTRQEKSLAVEIFRITHGGNDIPLAEYGGWTGKLTEHHDTLDDTTSGNPVYFDNDGVEYIGLNLIWNYVDFDLNFTWANLSGSRDYFSVNPVDNLGTSLGRQTVSGSAYLLDLGYRLTEKWKSTLNLFTASGSKAENDGEKIWEDSSKSFFEVKKGSFGDALIYLNGRNGIGDGHSVANLTFYGLNFAYRSKEDNFIMDLDLYDFSRTNAVFVNQKGMPQRISKDIGLELDFRIDWQLEERLFFQFYAAYFQPGVAYTVNDSIRPETRPKDFSMLGISGRYTF
mgnify:FL=1